MGEADVADATIRGGDGHATAGPAPAPPAGPPAPAAVAPPPPAGFKRGPLKYEVQTSSPQVYAGAPFSVNLTITNPYDVDVTIKSAVTRLPVEFRPWGYRRSSVGIFKQMIRDALESELDSSRGQNAESRGGAADGTTQQAVAFGADLSGQDSTTLQPGNSMVKAFALRTKHTLLFVPATYNLNFQVEYEMDRKTNVDVYNSRLDVRAPLKALIPGAIIGGMAAAFIRQYSRKEPEVIPPGMSKWFYRIGVYVSAAVVAMIAVVALSRKRDAQPFISVEDFYGALFVGFVTVYGGQETLQKLTKQ